MRPGEEQEGLANQDQEYTGDHRIPDVAVWAPDHEVPRRIPRREGASTLGGETPEARGEEQDSDPRNTIPHSWSAIWSIV